jgi:hypothetical protein
MAENTWGIPADNALIFPDILNDAQIAGRRPDLIFQYQLMAKRDDDGHDLPKPPYRNLGGVRHNA